MMTDDERRILACYRRNELRDEFRYAKTRQGSFESSFLSMEPLRKGYPALLRDSDRGAGAERIRAAAEPQPEWMQRWKSARRRLCPRERRILDLLLLGWSFAEVARAVGLSKPRVICIMKKNFKTHFMQCWRAYRRLRDER